VTGVSHKPGSPSAALRLPPLYPIIDVDLCRMRGLDPVAFAAGCVRGGARLLQVRQKGSTGGTGALLGIVREVIENGRPAGARVIVNDRADLAAMAGADGVHVGQQDLPPAAARLVAGRNAIVGISTHTLAQIDEAAAGTADYIAVGPVFRTTTKETGYDPRGLEMVKYAARTGRPVVAIGGITAVNARDVLSAGASSVAIISDLLAAGGPERRVREFLEQWLTDSERP
jgi:thiamine-phosphate pyrophosphorylase